MRRPLSLALAASLALGLAAPAVAQSLPSPGALAAQENAVWQAIADHRFDTFAAFLDRDYVGVYGGAIRNAAEDVADIRTISLTRFQISDFVVRGVDANNVVVTYQVDVSGSARGRDFAGRYDVASYWHRNGRQWHVQLHSQAAIGS
jgi:hypothetical protein